MNLASHQSLSSGMSEAVDHGLNRLWGARHSIRIWESGEWQTRTAECRQRSANPLPRKQMVAGLKRKRLGDMPSLP